MDLARVAHEKSGSPSTSGKQQRGGRSLGGRAPRDFSKAPPLAHNVIENDASFAHADVSPRSRRAHVTVDAPLLCSLLRHAVAVPRSVQDAGMPTSEKTQPSDTTRHDTTRHDAFYGPGTGVRCHAKNLDGQPLATHGNAGEATRRTPLERTCPSKFLGGAASFYRRRCPRMPTNSPKTTDAMRRRILQTRHGC
ncbi:hypothetical protein PLICRDRAFT_178244 [Plicaturopsis crispa FD-325 SS-3]|nr:hypothetical protein PLICRDRAFT_178244 [Plicaturopsis crispa FD-325 SS-3]